MRALALAALVLAAIAPNAWAASFFRLDGATAGEQAGVSVSGAGDVNNDGLADVIDVNATAATTSRSLRPAIKASKTNTRAAPRT
jgi:hypothetical protein